MDLRTIKWTWFWRTDGGKADCGVYAEPHPGHAYAVVRCPQYVSEEQWTEIATHIVELHNATINK